ncbi:MAG: tandem-95 repeat protein, partial [Planctomycetota bacterium]
TEMGEGCNTGAGTITFQADAPDDLPFHEILVFGTTDPVDLVTDVQYGSTSVNVDAAFGTGPDVFNVDEDSQDNSLDVLANDAFFPGHTGSLTITSVTPPSNGGTATITNGGGTILYTPPADFFGEETFQYTASDGASDVPGSVTVQVHPINDPPTAVDDDLNVTEDTSENFLDVLANDSIAPDTGETLRITSVSATQQSGTVTIGPTDDHLLYTPPANFNGQDSFTYTISDGNGGTDTATVTVTVAPFNDPPVARDDHLTIDEDTTDHLIDVLANDDTGADTDETLTLTQVFAPNQGGTATIENNQIRYSPAPDFFGEERIQYEISDGNGGTARAHVIVTVNNVNDPPAPADDVLTAIRDVSGQPLDVLANDSTAPDPADDVLRVLSVGQSAQGGTLTIAPDGSTVLYTPPANFTGTDTFTYTVQDSGGAEREATATVTVLDFVPGSIRGHVYFDVNDDGAMGALEDGIGNVTITLTGTDFRNETVQQTVETDANGFYRFTDLAPGSYTLSEESLNYVLDGRETAGSAGGDTSVNDQISLELADGTDATGYDFGERGRLPQFITHWDFFASTSRQGVLSDSIATPDNASGENGTPHSRWYSIRGSWPETKSVDVALAAAAVELVVVDTS